MLVIFGIRRVGSSGGFHGEAREEN